MVGSRYRAKISQAGIKTKVHVVRQEGLQDSWVDGQRDDGASIIISLFELVFVLFGARHLTRPLFLSSFLLCCADLIDLNSFIYLTWFLFV